MEEKILGVGNTATVYEYGKDKVCKLFKEGYPNECVKLEFDNAKLLSEQGLPVPKVYELVEKNNCTGIVYERIYGKSLMDMFINGEDIQHIFELFIALQQEILCHKSIELVSYKDFIRACMEKKLNMDNSIKKKIIELPEGNYICHGDYHPGNVIITPEGKAVIIDFMNVCHGPREYDIARTYFLMKESGIYAGDVSVADIYLQQMEMQYTDIEKYVEIITEYRKYE